MLTTIVTTGAPAPSTIEDLYEAYHPSIVKYFSRYGFTHEDAEDLTQDTFVKAWQALPTVHYDDLLPWLYCIAKHVALDAHRKKCVQQRNAPCYPFDHEERYAGVCTQEEMILTHLSLVEALQRIPERYQRALVFSAYGYSLPEIAALANYSSKAIKTIVHRGRKALKQRYQEG